MEVMFGILLTLVTIATITESRTDLGNYFGFRCRSAGQYLLHPGSRCQYIQCTYNYQTSSRYHSALIGVPRQCPPGTVVPRHLYSRASASTGSWSSYHPMSLCAQRLNVFNQHTRRDDCSVPKQPVHPIHVYGHDGRHDHATIYRPSTKYFRRPRKTRVPFITRIYKANSIQKQTVPAHSSPIIKDIKVNNQIFDDLPVMLNDLPDEIPTEQILNDVGSMMTSMAKDNELVTKKAEAVEKSEVKNYDYQMDPEEEAAILKEVRKLLPVEEAEILSEEDSNRVRQEMMDEIFNSI